MLKIDFVIFENTEESFPLQITSLACFEDDFGIHVEEYAASKGDL